ncbi:hypothetical protein ACFL19_00025 [Pseudomonadota bacterium]
MNKHNALLTLRDSYTNSDDGYEFLQEKVNQLGDPLWYVETTSDAARNRLLDWHKWLDAENLPCTFLVPCQEYALCLSGGYTNPTTGRIVVSSSTAIEQFKANIKLFSLLYAKRQNYVDWLNFTFEEFQSVLILDLDEYRKTSQAKGKLRNNTGCPRIERFLTTLRNYSKKASVISPFAEHELSYIRATADFISDYLDSIGLNYSQFSTSVHHEFIPIHIALPWLNFIIQRYESEDLKFFRLYWRLRRELNRSGLNKNPTIYTAVRCVTAIKDYVDGTYAFRTGARLDKVKKQKHFISQASEEIFGTAIDMEQFLNWLAKLKSSKKQKDFMPAKTSYYLSHLYAAIAMTNGPRRSEIATLRLSDFKEVTEEVSNYKSFIHKTNEGLPTIRQISGFVHDIAKKTCDIGLIDRQGDGVNLFYIKSGATNKHPHIDLTSKLFNRSYQSFLDSLPNEMAREIRQEMPKVTPHQARHLFAAFALRVSDGNVFEKIRHHFRHEYKSFMTNEYTEYKLSDMEQKHVEREYVREIIGRIANEKDHGYFGPMLSTLEKLIEEHLDFLPVDSINDLNEQLDELTDLIDTVKVHEWGLCLPLIATKVKSKCYDKETKMPQYDTGSSFNTCSGCIHLLSQEACLEDIQRIAIGISQTLENHPVISGSTRSVLELAYKRSLSLMEQCAKE